MPAPTSHAARRCCAPDSSSRRARSACWPPSGSRRSPSIVGRGSRSSRPATRSWRRAIRLRPGAVYDSNAAIIGAAVEELGGAPVQLGVIADDDEALASALARGLEADLVVFSGGTSKGAGDLSYRVVSRLVDPGVVAHGVALKPGKPICLAVTGGKPVVILPGFPTSAIFTFHEFVAPVIRAYAGLPAGAPAERFRHAADARELRTRTNRVPAGGAGAGNARPHRVSDGERLRLGDDVQRRGWLHHDRSAHRDRRCRQHGRGTAPGKSTRARRSRDHRQPLRRPRSARRQTDSLGAPRPSRSMSEAWAASRRPSAASAISPACTSWIPRRANTTVRLLTEALSLVPGYGRMQGIVYRRRGFAFRGQES